MARRILIIEDEEDDFMFTKRTLDRGQWPWPLRIDHARNYQMAHTRISHPGIAQTDLIIMDIFIPGDATRNGLDLIHTLRVAPLTKFIPVIAISHDDSREIIKATLEMGANAFVHKGDEPAMVATLDFFLLHHRWFA